MAQWSLCEWSSGSFSIFRKTEYKSLSESEDGKTGGAGFGEVKREEEI